MSSKPAPKTVFSGPPSALRDLARVRAPAGGGLYASAGDLFRDAVYGRDSLEAADHLLERYPDIVEGVVLSLCRLQGTQDVPAGPRSSEEQVGRIHHESRELVINGVQVGPGSARILESLSERWGGDHTRMTYYGSADATPLFCRVVARYCTTYGSDLLDRTYVDKDGRSRTVRDALVAATGWVEKSIDASKIGGVLEFQRRNPDGIEYQVWTDGKTSLLEPDGTVVDPSQPIATPELQGLAYDALVGAARVLEQDLPIRVKRWRHLANTVQARTVGKNSIFWVQANRYPAMAVTLRGGRPYQVTTVAATGAELFNSEILDTLPEAQRVGRIHDLIRKISSTAFVTDAGVRTISAEHKDMINYWQYQGAHTSWPKQTYDIAKGIRRLGYTEIADRFDIALLNTLNIEADHKEFLYVDDAGRAVHDAANVRKLRRPVHLAATNEGDETQTWTVSAVLAIKLRRAKDFRDRERGHHPGLALPVAERRFQDDVLRHMPVQTLLTQRGACAVALQQAPAVRVDRALGVAREMELLSWSKLHPHVWIAPTELGA